MLYLGEGVCVGPVSYDLLGDGRGVEQLLVHAVQQRQGLAWLHGRRVGSLLGGRGLHWLHVTINDHAVVRKVDTMQCILLCHLDVRLMAVAVGRGHVDQGHQPRHVLAQLRDAPHLHCIYCIVIYCIVTAVIL